MSKRWSREVITHIKSKTGYTLGFEETLGNGHLKFSIGETGKIVTTSKSPSGNKRVVLNNIAKDVRYKVSGHYN